MNMMEKFQEGIERVLVPLASKLKMSELAFCRIKSVFLSAEILSASESGCLISDSPETWPDGQNQRHM